MLVKRKFPIASVIVWRRNPVNEFWISTVAPLITASVGSVTIPSIVPAFPMDWANIDNPKEKNATANINGVNLRFTVCGLLDLNSDGRIFELNVGTPIIDKECFSVGCRFSSKTEAEITTKSESGFMHGVMLSLECLSLYRRSSGKS